MRAWLIVIALIGLSGCNRAHSRAQEIVLKELGSPKEAEFRRMRTKSDDADIVCGEVEASDRPGGGWRYFVAYVSIGRVAIAPPGGVGSEAEHGSILLTGEADRFNHMCD